MTHSEKLSLTLTKEMTQQLALQKGQEVDIELYADKLVLRKQEKWELKKLPSWLYLGATIVLSLIFCAVSLASNRSQILLVGDYSIITFLIGFGGLLGMGVFTATLIRNRHLFMSGLKDRVFWRMLPVIIVSFAVILLLVLLGFAWLLNQIFHGASFDAFTATLILGVSLYAVSIFWGQIAERIKATWLTTLFTVIMAAGVILAMATNSSRQWWQFNLSFLGTKEAISSWQFNLTLMLAAMILVAQVDYLFVALREKRGKDWKLTTLRILLTLLGLDLGAVGYFPNDAAYHVLHTRVAGYLVIIIIALIISVRWLLPKVTRDFLISSYVIGGVLVFLEMAFQVIHYLSLTAFEMSAFLLAFTWLIMLFNHLENLLIPDKQFISVRIL